MIWILVLQREKNNTSYKYNLRANFISFWRGCLTNDTQSSKVKLFLCTKFLWTRQTQQQFMQSIFERPVAIYTHTLMTRKKYLTWFKHQTMQRNIWMIRNETRSLVKLKSWVGNDVFQEANKDWLLFQGIFFSTSVANDRYDNWLFYSPFFKGLLWVLQQLTLNQT